jgi:GR25 family glycosyltransferase involved in LPS biosynthesis
LKKDLKRKKYMMDQLNNMKYNVRIEAIEDPSLESKLYSKKQISCLFSHFKAMKISLQDKNRDYCIICEDDIDFRNINNFQEIIYYYLKSAPSNWDVLQLFNIQNKQYKEVSTDLLKWEKWTKYHFSTMIYVIKKKFIHKLLGYQKSFNSLTKGLTADDFIYTQGITYSLKSPYFLDNIEFASNICIENKNLHEKNHNLLKTHQENINKQYPFN